MHESAPKYNPYQRPYLKYPESLLYYKLLLHRYINESISSDASFPCEVYISDKTALQEREVTKEM